MRKKDKDGNIIWYTWTEKPLFEVKNLKELNLDDEFVLKFLRYHKQHLMLRSSISNVLHLIKFSQNPLARKNLYYSLCYFSTLTKVSERWFKYWLAKNWEYSVFYTVHDISLFARGMEYHLAGTDLWDLNSRMWYDKKTFNSMFLPYHRYVFKVTAAIFYTLWSYIEGVRRMKYNEYVKSHYFGTGKRHIRVVRYIRLRFFWRGATPRLLKYRYFQYFKVQKYRIFRHSFHYHNRYDYKFDINRYKLMSQNKELYYHKHMEQFPWKTYWTPLIHDLLIMRLSFYSNHIVSHNTSFFTLYSRLDYSFVVIILWYFTFKNYYISYLYRMVSNLMINRWCGSIIHNEDNSDYSLILQLSESRQIMRSDQSVSLKTLAKKLDISTFSEVTYLEVLLNKYRFDMTDHLCRPNYYFWWAPESKLALLPHFSGNPYEEVDYMLARTIVWTNYWMWRDFSKRSEERILYEAHLEMPVLSKYLTVEYYYYSNQISMWAIFVSILRKHNLLMWSKSLEKYEKKQLDPKFDRKTKNYDVKDEWKRPLIHPMLKIMNQVYCEILKEFYTQFFELSWKLDILTHFLFKNDKQAFQYFNFHQERLWRNIPRVFFTMRRFYYVHTDILHMYRRYPRRRCVMSRNNPIYRAVWDVYYQKMRRTGIKVDIDLPYYSKSDDIDHIKELTIKKRNQALNNGMKNVEYLNKMKDKFQPSPRPEGKFGRFPRAEDKFITSNKSSVVPSPRPEGKFGRFPRAEDKFITSNKSSVVPSPRPEGKFGRFPRAEDKFITSNKSSVVPSPRPEGKFKRWSYKKLDPLKDYEKGVLLKVGPYTNLNNLFLKELTDDWKNPGVYVPKWKEKPNWKKFYAEKNKRKPRPRKPRARIVKYYPGYAINKYKYPSEFYQPKWTMRGRREELTLFTTREICTARDVNWKLFPGLYWERWNKDGKMTREEARKLYNHYKQTAKRVQQSIMNTIKDVEAHERAYYARREANRKNYAEIIRLKANSALSKGLNKTKKINTNVSSNKNKTSKPNEISTIRKSKTKQENNIRSKEITAIKDNTIKKIKENSRKDIKSA